MTISRAWIPNLLTMGSLLCGFWALTLAVDGLNIFPGALWLLFVASWLDIFDGGVARLLRVHSRFGQELDSLSDVVTFAVAPALLMYKHSLHTAEWMGILATGFFVCCGVGRLARYTSQASHEKRSYFVGMPIGIASVFAGLIVYNVGTSNVWLSAALVMVVGLFMVSTIPFPTPGQIAFQAPVAVRVILAVIWVCAMFRFDTWVFMPFSYFSYGVLQNLAPALRPAPFRLSIPQGGRS